MPVTDTRGQKLWQRRDRAEQRRMWLIWLIGTAIFMVCWDFISQRTIWMFVLDAPQQAFDMAKRMSNPRWSYLERIWKPLWDTINIATLGTLIGAGGIGIQLQASVNNLAWNQVSVIFLAILATVVISERVSARVRHAII